MLPANIVELFGGLKWDICTNIYIIQDQSIMYNYVGYFASIIRSQLQIPIVVY